MTNNRPPRSNIISAIFLFGFSTVIAIILFVIALVVWLAEAMGSLVAASLVVGGFFAILSLVIYMISLRGALDRMHERIETIYEVAQMAQTGYKWVREKFVMLTGLFERAGNGNNTQ